MTLIHAAVLSSGKADFCVCTTSPHILRHQTLNFTLPEQNDSLGKQTAPEEAITPHRPGNDRAIQPDNPHDCSQEVAAQSEGRG